MLESILKSLVSSGYKDFNISFDPNLNIKAKIDQEDHCPKIDSLIHPSQIHRYICTPYFLELDLFEFSFNRLNHYPIEQGIFEVTEKLSPPTSDELEDLILFEKNLTNQVEKFINELWINIDRKYLKLKWGDTLGCPCPDCWYMVNSDRLDEFEYMIYLPIKDGYLYCDQCEPNIDNVTEKIIQGCLDKWGIEL